MTAGIYVIYDKVSRQAYVGQARNIEKRWKKHKAGLRGGYHYNKGLQAAYTLSNGASLRWTVAEVIENATDTDLDRREYVWVERFKSIGQKLFNKAEIHYWSKDFSTTNYFDKRSREEAEQIAKLEARRDLARREKAELQERQAREAEERKAFLESIRHLLPPWMRK